MAFQALPKISEDPRRYRFDTSILSEVSKEYRLRLVEERDSALINELRGAAYGAAEEFQLFDLTPVLWNGLDSSAIVLAVEVAGQVVASMRAGLVGDSRAMVQHLDASWPSSVPFTGPVMVLERAATRPGYRRLGLNSLLRYCFIKMAIAAGIKQVAGSVYQGATRIHLMESLGYRFYCIEEDHDSWAVRTPGRRLITVLDLERDGQTALSVLTAKLGGSHLLAARA